MVSLFLRSLKELAWRTLHPLKAKRAYAAAQAMAAAVRTADGKDGQACSDSQLRGWLEFPWWEVRNLGVKMVHHTRDGRFIPFLQNLLNQRSDTGIIRRNAITALRDLNAVTAPGSTPDMVATLTHCLYDPYWEVRREAAISLAAHPPLPRDTQMRLINLARKERAFEVQLALAHILGRSHAEKAFPCLYRMTGSRSWQVRLQSAVALVELVDTLPALRPSVINILKNLENICAGVTGHMLFQERIFDLEELVSRSHWPASDDLSRLYLLPDIPWTKQ